jgi:lipoprotein-anchoring transpeptidase ErfK/SrfK
MRHPATPSSIRRLVVASLAVASLASASGCDRLDNLWSRATAPDSAAEPLDAALTLPPDPSLPPLAADDAGGSALDPDDAGAPDDDAGADAGPVDAGPRTMITALGWRTGIVEAPQANAHWIGYVRAGGQIAIVRGPVGNDGCPARRDMRGAGWYEVEGSGFVCVGPLAMLTSALGNRPITRRLPTPPDIDASMPFTYARSTRATAVYRWLPTEEEERATEPERFAPRAAAGDPDGGAGGAAATAVATASDAGARSADAQVRIEDLEGLAGTALMRRTLRGMYVSLNREARAPGGTSFWHTQSGGYIRANTLSTLRGDGYFQGVALDEQHHLPIAVALSTVTSSYQASGRAMSTIGRVPRLAIIQLADEPPVTVGNEQYYHTAEGFFLRSRQVRVVTRHEPPADLSAPDEKWIDVNLDHQSVVAYEGARPVYVTVASTGRRNRSNPEENYETIQGAFRILSKHVATTMDGNSANDGPYSIEDVPWVMYFEGSFALHGAFWHNGFGAMHSHGCVNMSPPDARWFYNWTEPHVAPGWNGAYANVQHPGTRVYVHYDEQALGTRGGPDRVPQH